MKSPSERQRKPHHAITLLLTCLFVVGLAPVEAQTDPFRVFPIGLAGETVPVGLDSGPVDNSAPSPAAVYDAEVGHPGATWIRIFFGPNTIIQPGSRIRITSLYDGAVQHLDTDTLGPIRPITEAKGQMHHDLSLSYNGDTWSLTAGINNVFDKEPPLIDQGAGPNRNNAVTSGRYDNIGRSYFARFNVSF